MNELVVRRDCKVALVPNGNYLLLGNTCIEYSLIDASRYSFEYVLDEDITANMYESDRSYDSSDFEDADFDTGVNENHFQYYRIAAASGLITGFFSSLDFTEDHLKKISEWKEKDWNQYIVLIAKLIGFKDNDLKGAISFIKNRLVTSLDIEINKEVKAGFDSWLRFLSGHPSIAGLFFSILTQFSHKRYRFVDNELCPEKVPAYYAFGRNFLEKILYGFLYWVFNLATEMMISSRNILDDMKIPKEIISLIKELCKTPIFKKIPHDIASFEEAFSKILRLFFEKAHYWNNEGEKKLFNLNDEVKNLKIKTFMNSVPVLINECIVRAAYFIKKMIVEIKEKKVQSFADFDKIEITNVLPFNNRLVSRMILVSSGCFVGVNIAGAVVKAIMKKKTSDRGFAETLFTEVNIAGVGRFIFACIADFKYWSDDIKILFQRKKKKQTVQNESDENIISGELLEYFSLSPEQMRVLKSLECIAVSKDIEHTDSAKEKELKKSWLSAWKKQMLESYRIENEEFFITDENEIYSYLHIVEQNKSDLCRFYLMAMEYITFRPYHPLGVDEDVDKEYKKLERDKYNYIDDQFVRRQTIISQAEVDSIRQYYKKYKNYITGRTRRLVLTSTVVVATTVVAGGLALAFAPGIATMIAGEAVAGLHGAALTSASLAFVGGGSLAAGGFGMAGGTVIITGGGALLGITGSGSVSIVAMLSQTSDDYWIWETTKMLVFSKCVLKDKIDDTETIHKLSAVIEKKADSVEKELEEIKKEDCSLDEDNIKRTGNVLKYLRLCKKELDDIVK